MWIEIIALLVVLGLVFYLRYKRKYQYWKKRGVYQIEPTIPWGSIPEFFSKTKALNDVFLEHNKETKGLPYYGIYFFGSPLLVIKDICSEFL